MEHRLSPYATRPRRRPTTSGRIRWRRSPVFSRLFSDSVAAPIDNGQRRCFKEFLKVNQNIFRPFIFHDFFFPIKLFQSCHCLPRWFLPESKDATILDPKTTGFFSTGTARQSEVDDRYFASARPTVAKNTYQLATRVPAAAAAVAALAAAATTCRRQTALELPGDGLNGARRRRRTPLDDGGGGGDEKKDGMKKRPHRCRVPEN